MRSRTLTMKTGVKLAFGLAFSCLAMEGAEAVDLTINEFQAINVSTVADEFGEFEDWVEIHNFGTTPVNVEGMFLTDDFTETQRYEFPDAVIQPGGYLVIWCDGESEQGEFHAELNLDGDGEDLGLFDTLFEGMTPIDTFVFGPQMSDVSFGRYPNGTGPRTFLGSPTPGADNDAPYNLPPLLVGTGHFPGAPTDADEVFVTVEVIEDFGLDQVLAFFDAGSGFSSLAMSDDGLNGDGAAGDGVWGATIPALPDGPVNYYVSALDDSGAVAFAPAGAPGEFYAYEVGYEPPALYINELLASNDSVNMDEAGQFEDWVEIYNGSGEDVFLGGMYLSDDPLNPTRFEFPAMILAAGDFALVWCDDDTGQGPLHTEFKLSAGGEDLGLYDTAAHGLLPIDTRTFGAQETDISEGRESDGAATWVFFAEPTPGAPNDPTSSAPEDVSSSLRVEVLGNPSFHRTGFSFDLPSSEAVEFSIYSVEGREVTRLLDREMPAGKHGLVWDGSGNIDTASGVFFYRLRAGQQERVGTFVRVR